MTHGTAGPEQASPGRVGEAHVAGMSAREGNRLGWMLGSIWVLFLIYPLISSLTADAGWLGRGFAAALTVGFGALYVRTMWWMDSYSLRATPSAAMLRLGCLLAIVAATVPVIGIEALGFAPFLVAYSAFALPRTGGAVVFGTVIAVTIVVPALTNAFEEWWFMTMIVMLVGVTTGVMRLIADRAAAGEVAKEQLAVVAERERVARDVHDVIGHSLTVVIVKAELAERLLEVDPDRTRGELREIISLSREALAEVRATVGGLRVARLGDELGAAAQALRAAGIAADVPEEPDAVDPRYRIIFAWVLREAITNVVRHSGATACSVELGQRRMTVIDDGRGWDEGREGNGIRGARERVEAAAGSLTVSGGPGGAGTVFTVEM